MQHVEPSSLRDLPSRISYLQSFMGFSPAADGPQVNSLKPVLAPLLPTILDAVYTHLLSYDITARYFAPAQPSADGPSPGAGMDEKDPRALSLDHVNIQHRKHFLKLYLVRLLSNEDWTPSSAFWRYADQVGRAHTGAQKPSGKSMAQVDYVHSAALLAWVQDQIVAIVMGFSDETGEWTVEHKTEALRALGKVWWIQNDLFARPYIEEHRGKNETLAEKKSSQRDVKRIALAGLAGLLTGVLSVRFLYT